MRRRLFSLWSTMFFRRSSHYSLAGSSTTLVRQAEEKGRLVATKAEADDVVATVSGILAHQNMSTDEFIQTCSGRGPPRRSALKPPVITAIDTNVLSDILRRDPQHYDWASQALRLVLSQGAIVACEGRLG